MPKPNTCQNTHINPKENQKVIKRRPETNKVTRSTRIKKKQEPPKGQPKISYFLKSKSKTGTSEGPRETRDQSKLNSNSNLNVLKPSVERESLGDRGGEGSTTYNRLGITSKIIQQAPREGQVDQDRHEARPGTH